MKRIYMDHQATTPVEERVAGAMRPWFSEQYGNAASEHAFGKEATEAVDRAREQVASLICADPREIVFTSGATESDNLAIQGVVRFHREKGNHIITVATEHRAVLGPCRAMEERGEAKVTYLPVDKEGLVDPAAVRDAITEETVLVSVMHANNEIGVLQPIDAIGKVCREKGILFHTDATQAVGNVPFDVNTRNVDLVSLSAHKMYGPKGVGALYVRMRNPRVRLEPIVFGGGQENGLRSGTLPVPLLVGLGAASALAEKEGGEEAKRLLALRERLRAGIFEKLEHVTLNGSAGQRLPGNLNVSFAYVEGGSLLKEMPEVAVSTGAACTTTVPEPSHVLQALGVREDLIPSTIRFGLGRGNTEEDVDIVLDLLVQSVQKLRKASPLYPQSVS